LRNHGGAVENLAYFRRLECLPGIPAPGRFLGVALSVTLRPPISAAFRSIFQDWELCFYFCLNPGLSGISLMVVVFTDGIGIRDRDKVRQP
jgi:hypothetical protein